MSTHHGYHRPDETTTYPDLNYSSGAKWIKQLTQERLNHFHGGRYSDFNLSSMLYIHRLDDAKVVQLQVWSAPGLEKPSFSEAMKQQFRPAKKGEVFGPSWTNHWWKVSIIIPASWEQYDTVQFEFDPGCEAMIFSADGTPLQGITGGHDGTRRVEYIIPQPARQAGVHHFVIESTCNGMFGVGDNIIGPPDMNRKFMLASADLVVPNVEAWALLYDFTVLKQLASSLPGSTPLQNRALVAANEIMNVFAEKGACTDAAYIAAARRVAETVFGCGWEAKGAGLYEEGPLDARVWGIGHCHIDTAWLWPFSATQQKVARSWSTQVDLMDRYPEHRFACSSALQYKWLEELYPALFARVKEKVLSGQFHPVGGAWVEHDANMPSGEALVRQMMFGQQYFESRFGKRCETGWLPDSFGLTGALPQLFRGAGMKYFFTQKLSWNSVNRFPHSTFNWVGIDGTQVLCHMTPIGTYAAQASVDEVLRGMNNHKNLESNDTALLVFGNGDGGGGPLAAMLENLRRIRATAIEHREIPVVTMGGSVEQFFEHVQKSTRQGRTLPNWHGELYLEFHRGTFTSHGSIKMGNRKSEILLRDLELAATLASLCRICDYVYPKARINSAWEKVLLNQFHDVLPGSAIGMVYEDAEKLYAEVRSECEDMLAEALAVLFPFPSQTLLRPDNAANATATHSALSQIVGFNTTCFPRLEVVRVPLPPGGSGDDLRRALAEASRDKELMFQEDEFGGRDGFLLMRASADSPIAMARGVFIPEQQSPIVYTDGPDHFMLGNYRLRLTVSKGRITSLMDLYQGRELIADGMTGGLVIFEDRPNFWDAWDVEVHHLETARPLLFSDIRVVASGPLRASVQAKVKVGKSLINLTISLDAVPATQEANSLFVFKFDAQVDWHERHELLKFELPLSIHNDYCTYETSFGCVKRPTHKNTSWDMAKFEVCGHKFADLSEFGYGVAILSESKYGFACQGNVLNMSLLRAATAPDAEQDQGLHSFSWGILPHQGVFAESDVPIAGHLFNSQMRLLPPHDEASLNQFKSPFVVEGAKNVFLETIKRGEHDDFDCADSTGKSVILRLYEAYGGHAQVRLKIARNLDVRKAFLTNLLEDECDEIPLCPVENATVINLCFRGFEVKTVKLVMASEKDGRRESWVTIDRIALA